VPGLKETPRPILARDTVKHVGDPVAMVIAETLQQAKDAAEKVEVDYEPLRAVVDAREGEVAFEVGLGESKAKVDAAIAKGGACHAARAGQQPAGREPDRAARRARRVRRGERAAPRSIRRARARTTSTARSPTASSRRRASSCAWFPATSAALSA
jgi:CO/xanthine dehydrogenase Mo-binding subunit